MNPLNFIQASVLLLAVSIGNLLGMVNHFGVDNAFSVVIVFVTGMNFAFAIWLISLYRTMQKLPGVN